MKPDSVEGRMVMQLRDTYKQLQKALAEGIYQAGENFRQTEKNSTGEGGSIRFKINYNDAIDLLDAGELDRTQNTHLKLLDYTPRLYIDKADAKNLKIITGWDIAYLAMKKEGEIPGNYHGLGKEVMKKIPAALHDPLYVVKQPNGRIIAITEITVKGNRSTIVSLELDAFKSTKQDGEFESENYNLILTFMDAKPNYLKNTIFSGDVVYNKNNEDPANFILRLKSLKKAVPDDDLAKSSNKRVPHQEEEVKENDSAKSGIRTSIRQKQNAIVADMLKKEVEKLKGDVEKLKELLKLQRSITGGTKFTASSVEAAARVLKKNAGATGDTAELAGLLNRFYEYIATERELTWEGVKEQARAAADWLQEHVKHRRSDYAQEILDQLHGSKIYLDESQKQEAAHHFGSFNAFRQAVMGSITVANEASTSLDSFWQEMSALYPDVFDGEMTAGDMPRALADVIDRLRNEDTSLLEYAYRQRLDAVNMDTIKSSA